MQNIQKTTDYSQFKFYPTNRGTHLTDIIESIKEKNMLETFPIVVSKDFQVIDGQHRLMAAKELKLPIYYIISEEMGEEDIARCQVQKPWKLEDFLHFYMDKILEYRQVAELAAEFKESIGFVIKVSSKFFNASRYFRGGKFKFIKPFEEMHARFCAYRDFKQFILKRCPTNFSVKSKEAIFNIANRPPEEFEKIRRKLERYPDRIKEALLFRETANIIEALMLSKK